MSVTTYKYKHINGHSELRLLKLEPGDVLIALQGSLVAVSLASCPPFEAISYAWEDTIRSHSVETPEGRILINASLHQALIRLRQKQDYRFLWADAICINQDDPCE
jgi:Heterokaryon incompatibility protein (HET)